MFDGPGIRTTVFLKGCPLDCWWCQNPESIGELPEQVPQKDEMHKNVVGKKMTADEVLVEILKDSIFYDESDGGVTFSGGEPMVQVEFLTDVITRCKQEGIHTAIDTSGYAPWSAFESILPHTDLFLYDLKIIDNTKHYKYTNVSNHLIQENLKKLHKTGANVVMRIPLIPEITDTTKNLNQIIGFLKTLPKFQNIDLLPFNHYSKSKYERFNKEAKLSTLRTQTKEELANIALMFEKLDAIVDVRS